MRTPAPLVAWAVGLCLCAAVPAQSSASPHDAEGRARPSLLAGPTTSILGQATSLASTGGQLLGGGPDYEVRFTDDGPEFTPALGKDAPRTYPLRLRLQSFGRSQGALLSAGQSVRTTDSHTVRYQHAALIVEYAVRPQGVEQSFIFAALPEGSGDLIVRCRIETDLPLARAVADEVRFAVPGLGGVRIGEVVGIDAAGRRAKGALRFSAGELELSLPAELVESAALPLVLDPLIGSAFAPSSSFDDQDPDVAWDDTTGRYLVVWQRSFSATSNAIRGQLVTATGSLVGSFLSIRSGDCRHPRVANVSLRDTFVVVWEDFDAASVDLDVLAAGVDASSGAVSAAITVAGGSGLQHLSDVGGEATTVDDDAIVVWASGSKVQASQIQVGLTGTLTALGTVDIFTNSAPIVPVPALSQSGGPTGQYLIVWAHRSFSSLGDIGGAVVDRNLNILASSVGIATSNKQEGAAAVDGDGTGWIVAYETYNSIDKDIACVSVTYAGGQAVVGSEVIIEGDVNDEEIRPSVAWLGGSVLIGYADEAASLADHDTYVKSVDPFTCTSCEGELTLETGARNADYVKMASQRSGGTATDEALLVWESTDTTTLESDLLAWRFRGDDGLVTDLGGGCGAGGAATSTCAITGNAGFTMRVRGAAPASAAWLILASDVISLPCGACTLVPNAFRSFVFNAGSTDANGNAGVAAAIPSSSALVGVTLYQQWLVAGAGCLGGFDFSNALSVMIQ